MNIVLWVVQVLLALHTAMGAFWKLSNSEQTVPSLKAIPHGVWLALIGFELLCSVGLVLPAFIKALGNLPPIAASCIVAEMLLFTAVHVASGAKDNGPMTYWLVVAVASALLAYGRFVSTPL